MVANQISEEDIDTFQNQDELTSFITADPEVEIEEAKLVDKTKHQCGLIWSCNMIVRFISVIFVTFVLYKVIPDFQFFSIHPTLMVIAYPLCMLEAILLFSSWPIINTTKKSTKLNLHGFLQFLCLTLASIGAGVAFYNKILLNKPHYQSWHSWFGLSTVILSFLNAMGGVASRYPSLVQGKLRPLVIKTIHATAACFTCTSVCLALISGLRTTFFANLTAGSSYLWNLAYAVPVVILLAVVSQVYQSYVPRYRKA